MSEQINQVECPDNRQFLLERFNALQLRVGPLHIDDVADAGIFFQFAGKGCFLDNRGTVREIPKGCEFSEWVQSISAGGGVCWRVPTNHDLAAAEKPITCRVRDVASDEWVAARLQSMSVDPDWDSPFFADAVWWKFCEIPVN